MDPNSHQYLRFSLELLSFLSNIVLACIAIAALYQIILAKRSLETARLDIELRSKREAVTLAADKVAEFAENIIPKCNLEFRTLMSAGISIDRWELQNNRFDESSFKDWNAALKWEEQLRASKQVDSATRVLNQLESFAMYFAKGAADEQVAYSAVGAIFRNYVDLLAPHLTSLRILSGSKNAYVTSGPFQNVVTLYEVWLSRARKEALQQEATRITSELSGISTSDILPIGTKAQ